MLPSDLLVKTVLLYQILTSSEYYRDPRFITGFITGFASAAILFGRLTK